MSTPLDAKEASAALAATERLAVGSERDARIRGAALALQTLCLGLELAYLRYRDPDLVAALPVLAALLGLVLLTEFVARRAAPTLPLGGTRWAKGALGFAGGGVMLPEVIRPLEGTHHSASWAVATVLLALVPGVVAGTAIATLPRRRRA